MYFPAEDFFTFLRDSRSVAFVECDRQWIITSCNRCFQDCIGAADDLRGTTLLSLLQPKSAAALLRQDTAPSENGPRVLYFKTAGGDTAIWCSIHRTPQVIRLFGERRWPAENEVLQKMSAMNNEMVNLARDLRRKNRELEQANSTIRTLRGIIPICSFCKDIRNDEGYWKQLEEYMAEVTEAQFSHGICPSCMEEHYPETSE